MPYVCTSERVESKRKREREKQRELSVVALCTSDDNQRSFVRPWAYWKTRRWEDQSFGAVWTTAASQPDLFLSCRLCVWASAAACPETTQRILSLLFFNDNEAFLLFFVLPFAFFLSLLCHLLSLERKTPHPLLRFRRILRSTALYLCSRWERIHITENVYVYALCSINYRFIFNNIAGFSVSHLIVFRSVPLDFRIPLASLILRKTNTSPRVHAPTKHLCPVERYWDVRSIYRAKTHLSFTNRREISPGWSFLDYRETRRRMRETEQETNGCRSLCLSVTTMGVPSPTRATIFLSR